MLKNRSALMAILGTVFLGVLPNATLGLGSSNLKNTFRHMQKKYVNVKMKVQLYDYDYSPKILPAWRIERSFTDTDLRYYINMIRRLNRKFLQSISEIEDIQEVYYDDDDFFDAHTEFILNGIDKSKSRRKYDSYWNKHVINSIKWNFRYSNLDDAFSNYYDGVVTLRDIQYKQYDTYLYFSNEKDKEKGIVTVECSLTKEEFDGFIKTLSGQSTSTVKEILSEDIMRDILRTYSPIIYTRYESFQSHIDYKAVSEVVWSTKPSKFLNMVLNMRVRDSELRRF